ncbi:MAG TPA: pyruvate carboxylase subunit B [Bacteroidales bacterium]|nr:pyruvate carboxylase subunit B [Bacteroidales bacterium]
MEKKEKLRITDTTLRDGHQSLWATRMRTSDMLGIIDVIDQAGYYSLEVWGGATFDVCLRFLRENPWERLRLIKQKAPKTPLQMLLRGQNVVGYKNYPDDLLDRFVETALINGVDIFRIFDALNDTRNLEAAFKSVRKHGGHVQGTLSYTISPVHTFQKYVEYAREQVQVGIDSLCIKDMAGILSPAKAAELVGALKQEFDIPIQVHCHATSGMSETAYLAGVKAGAGAIDGAVAALSGYSSQPATETLYAIFSGLGYDTGLDIEAIRKVNRYFQELTPKRVKGKGYEPLVDTEILDHQIPGGMISNFRSQLEQQDALDKLPEVLEEVVMVRKDLGYPPLVTPTSQIVGTQAVMNILAGERYKIVPQEVRNYVKGMYGRPPVPIEGEFVKKILGDEKPITHRPADDLAPILPTVTKSISQPELLHDEEDIISYCLFPEVAMDYFKWRALPENKRPMTPADLEIEEMFRKPAAEPAAIANAPAALDKLLHPEDYAGIQTILEKASMLQLNELVISKGDFNLSLVSGDGNGSAKPRPVRQPAAATGVALEQASLPKAEKMPAEAPATTSGEPIKAVMAGTFYRAPKESDPPFVEVGKVVEAGDTICILEAMKLFNEIKIPFKCRILRILVENSQKVTKGQPIMEVEKL